MILKFNLSTKESTNNINFKFDVTPTQTPEDPFELVDLKQKLNKYRNKIDNIKSDDWKKVRWYINEYDFLVKDPVINRAFYKYWEIINEFQLFETYNETDIILHCAEAPGGFIQGSNIFLQLDRKDINETQSTKKQEVDKDGFIMVTSKKKQKQDYRIYTISLNKDLPKYKLYNLPNYNKNVINKHVCITYGKDKTGDINNWENIDYIKTLSKKNFYLITADGGFDEGTDFNNKEQLHYQLILSEIYSAISLQDVTGHFILKVFDIFTNTSIQLLYLLNLCYDEVYIYKPKTSRPTNSEKYIICKNFKIDEITRKNIISQLHILLNKIQKTSSKYISFTLFDNVPKSFLNKISEINSQLLETQCIYLEKAIELCSNKSFLESYEKNLEKSIEKRRIIFKQWEELYNLNVYV
jgi:23S rRNA U2552 (ribose-2'-O)-methylase RlmE/FtsJ